MDQKVSDVREQFDVGGILMDRPFKILRLGHFAFDVADTAASAAFYSDLLGLRIIDKLNFRDIVPDPSVLDGLEQTEAIFMNFGTDHHSFVDLGSWRDEEGPALFDILYPKRRGGAGFPGDKRAFRARGYGAHLGQVAVEEGVHQAQAARCGEELVAKAEQAARGDNVFQVHHAL